MTICPQPRLRSTAAEYVVFCGEHGGIVCRSSNAGGILEWWKGHCSVHQMFQSHHILKFRNQHPHGLVISHPECKFEVCKLSDHVGSTETIIKIIAAAPANTRWLVGAELNLVNAQLARVALERMLAVS